jgi:hypothetical protein
LIRKTAEQVTHIWHFELLNTMQILETSEAPTKITKTINKSVTVLDIIHRPVFYLKHTMDNVRTSQETLFASATSPTG